MEDGRWTTVTESNFDHERRGLEAIRQKLPNIDPWYAWSNFTFTATTGHIREVDLLVIAPNGVHMIELKDWSGSVTSENGTWVQSLARGGRRFHNNPLYLVNQKSKELSSLLGAKGVKVFLHYAVCFSNSGLKFHLPTGDRANTHTVSELLARLNEPVDDIRQQRVDAIRAKQIKKALEQVGIRRSDAEFTVGPYRLHRKPFDAGSTWQDYLAEHSTLHDQVRVRIYLRARGADPAARKSVDAAARREAAVLGRFRHPGVVQLKLFDPSGHSAGPALIFGYHPETLHLDDYLARYGEHLDILDRVKLVRDLAETLKSAHSMRLYHRALAARSIHVIRGRGGTELERWRHAHLQISDWQVATQRAGATGRTKTRHAPTALSATHLAADSNAYLAPELAASNPDPIALDVYGLGMLTYLLLTGQPPAASQAELLARFEAEESLRPSAVMDGLPLIADLMVQVATAYKPTDRLTSIDEFLESLEELEDILTTPPESEPGEPEKDPLDAAAGDTFGAGRWRVVRRLGTGSTSRALLVRDLQADPTGRGASPYAVLKVALSEDRSELLRTEADVLGHMRRHSGIISLVDPGLTTLGDRTAIVLEYVGDDKELESSEKGDTRKRTEETVARELRDNGRLQVARLELYGDSLFNAVDFLEGEGVWHRDLKPDNIAIRVRPNRTRELVLIDFSLSRYPVQHTEVGTEGYLDPFIGTLTRSVYDAHAERYALAATLHEMASGELPRWGDGSELPRQLSAEEYPCPDIAADAFDPSVRDGLVAFFRKAMHRDVAQRFPHLKAMRDAWKKLFLDMSQTTPSRPHSQHPPVSTESVEQEREAIAEQVTRETHLSAAGLSPEAEQFLYELGVTTVGELVDYGRNNLINAPGLGARVRREIHKRQAEWGRRLGKTIGPLTRADREQAKAEFADTAASPDDDLSTLSLDALAARFVPERNNNGTNANKVDAIVRLLRIPGVETDAGLDAWPTQTAVADSLKLTSARIAQLVKAQRQQWKRDPAVQALRAQILDLLRGFGRVAAASELADALTAQRGTRLQDRAERRALALAAVRVVVEVEQLAPDTAALRHSYRRDSGHDPVIVIALEVGPDDDPKTASAPALLTYAQRLGKAASTLAEQETLPTAATVLERLRAIEPPSGLINWNERRLVQVAVGASRIAAATPRLEIYSRDLSLVRAIRLTQAGLVRMIAGVATARQPGLEPKEVHERIRARFPELNIDRNGHNLPTGEPLTKALRDAGFRLVLATREDSRTLRYLPEHADDPSSYTGHFPLRATDTATKTGIYSDDRDVATAARAEERLTDAARRDGFRVLTVQTSDALRAVAALTDRFGARPTSVTELFLAALHDLVPTNGRPTWETILRADIAEPGSRSAVKLTEYTRTAWGRLEPELMARFDEASPLLLTDTLVFARYDAMTVLNRLAEAARRGRGGLWLLAPQSDPAREPRLGGVAVPYQSALHEWIPLQESWIRNVHRAAANENVRGVIA